MFKEACMFFASEIAQASTGMAPALAGIVGGRPKASPVIVIFILIDKNQVNVEIDFDGQRHSVEIPKSVSAQKSIL